MELLVRLQVEKDELAAKYSAAVRQLADLDNARKRIERERREDAARITAHVIEPMLPVLDAFERALAAHSDPAYEEYRKGFELIYRQLLEALGRFGVERIEALGRPFDPHVHQAVERVESSEHEDGTVVEDLRHGYKLRERVLRPALVRVAFRPATELADADSQLN
jgi:molecular chaperone GrpE